MEIKAFTVTDLKTVLLSEDFWHTQTLPITKHRALSYCHNPRADEDDPVLLVAYEENRVIGYLGILPDNIFAGDTVHKLGWLTSWWVDPSDATSGVGTVLLFKALNAYRQQLGVSGASRSARRVLDASQKFASVKTLKGLDIRLRLNATAAVLRKLPALKPLRVGFKIFDDIMEEIMNLRSFFWQRRSAVCQRLTFEHISAMDEETGRFIRRHNRQDLTRKESADLNWVMMYPWILGAPLKDSAGQRYYFASRADRFFYLGVKVYEQSREMVGFFLLKVRDDRMSVEYSFFENRHALTVAAAVVCHALAMNVSALRLYDEYLVASFSELRCPHWSAGAISRGFSLSKALADIPLTGCRFHGGDGDLAFY